MPNVRYEVNLLRKAEKDLDDLKQYRDAVVVELLKLENDPYLGHSLQGILREVRSLEFNLPNYGECRAAYVINKDQKVCIIFLVGPHENFYQKAERRAQAALRRAR